MKGCMRAMVAQLKSESEDLQQVSSPVTFVPQGNVAIKITIETFENINMKDIITDPRGTLRKTPHFLFWFSLAPAQCSPASQPPFPPLVISKALLFPGDSERPAEPVVAC